MSVKTKIADNAACAQNQRLKGGPTRVGPVASLSSFDDQSQHTGRFQQPGIVRGPALRQRRLMPEPIREDRPALPLAV